IDVSLPPVGDPRVILVRDARVDVVVDSHGEYPSLASIPVRALRAYGTADGVFVHAMRERADWREEVIALYPLPPTDGVPLAERVIQRIPLDWSAWPGPDWETLALDEDPSRVGDRGHEDVAISALGRLFR